MCRFIRKASNQFYSQGGSTGESSPRDGFARGAITGKFGGRATGSTLYQATSESPPGVSRWLTRLPARSTSGAWSSVLAAILCVSLMFGTGAVMARDGNLTDSCVDDFDPAVDYFPDKADISQADKLDVSYHGHYKVVTVNDSYDEAPAFQYVLTQCGAPAPAADAFPRGAQFINVPAGDLITLSTTQLPPLIQLDLLDHLVGIDSGFYVSSPAVTERVADGTIAEVGFGADINIELTLELQPSLVLTYGFNPATDAHPILRDAGIFTALDASWRETSPLGRAEWLKFIALFYNREAEAEALFDAIASDYDAARQLAADIPEGDKPTLLLNSFLGYADAWYIPGADSYAGQMMRDAGARLLLSAEGSRESQPHSFEAVYAAALDADIWLVETFAVNSLDDLLAIDSRFGDFAAYQAGAVWNNNADENANGGNNYYEWGVANPQLVLRDLAAIMHPEVLPDHEFAFYKQLNDD